jgi:glycosyltransferase involved in cell wall biosynthesis
MRRVLIVAYYYPPIAGIGSIRLASFARHLPEFGWEPTVLAPERTPHPEDPSIAFPREKVVRSRSIELSRLARAMPESGGGGAKRSRSRTDAVRAFGRRSVFPDPQIGWFPAAVRAGHRLLREGRVDAVYSSSYPMTAHLIAMRLTGRSGLPWVAECRDPWSDRLPSDSPHRARARRLEAKVAARASRMIMPSPSWAEHFAPLWGTEIDVILNGHDPPPRPSPQADPTLVHLGSFYPGRQDLAPIWAGLRRWSDSNGARLPAVRFIGEVDAAVRAQAAVAGVHVEASGQVPHHRALELLGASSMAFASGELGRDPIARGTIPAKLAEYLASGLPILYVGDPAGDAAALLAGQPGCHVVEPGDEAAIAAAVEQGLTTGRHDREIDAVSRRSGARLLAASLRAAVERPARQR